MKSRIAKPTKPAQSPPYPSTLRAALDEADADAPEEAARFYGKYEAGFKAGAKWALNRWRAAMSPPVDRQAEVVAWAKEPGVREMLMEDAALYSETERAALHSTDTSDRRRIKAIIHSAFPLHEDGFHHIDCDALAVVLAARRAHE